VVDWDRLEHFPDRQLQSLKDNAVVAIEALQLTFFPGKSCNSLEDAHLNG
jgi:hypothetical protein